MSGYPPAAPPPYPPPGPPPGPPTRPPGGQPSQVPGYPPPYTPPGPPAGSGSPRPRRSSDHVGSAIVGLLLILVGAWVLARDYLDADMGRLWPVGAVVLGAVLIVLAFVRRPAGR